jgi:hypothetical protein
MIVNHYEFACDMFYIQPYRERIGSMKWKWMNEWTKANFLSFRSHISNIFLKSLVSSRNLRLGPFFMPYWWKWWNDTFHHTVLSLRNKSKCLRLICYMCVMLATFEQIYWLWWNFVWMFKHRLEVTPALCLQISCSW